MACLEKYKNELVNLALDDFRKNHESEIRKKHIAKETENKKEMKLNQKINIGIFLISGVCVTFLPVFLFFILADLGSMNILSIILNGFLSFFVGLLISWGIHETGLTDIYLRTTPLKQESVNYKVKQERECFLDGYVLSKEETSKHYKVLTSFLDEEWLNNVVLKNKGEHQELGSFRLLSSIYDEAKKEIENGKYKEAIIKKQIDYVLNN